MAQFDVHRMLSPSDKSVAYVVVVQSSQYDGYRRRVVVPLHRRTSLSAASRAAGTRANPTFFIENVNVVLNPLEVFSIRIERLGEKVTNLAADRESIVAAMDELLTCAWG